MPKLVAIIGGITGTTIIGGVGAYYLSTQNKSEIKTSKFSEVFKHALIKLDNTEEVLLNAKLKKLKQETPKSNITKLQTAKTTTGDPQALAIFKEACQEIYDSNFTNRESNIFKDFQSYCARTNKDTVADGEWAPSNAQWKVRYDKLTGNNLTSELTEIKSKKSQTGNELKDWCNKVGDLVFEGNEDPTNINAKVFCGKTD